MAASVARNAKGNFYGIIVSAQDMQKVRDYLKQTVLKKNLIIKKVNVDECLIAATTTEFTRELNKLVDVSDEIPKVNGISVKLSNTPQMELKKREVKSPYRCLLENLKILMQKNNLWDESCKEDIPNHWEKHGDLILLPPMSFLKSEWNKCPNLWETVANILKCKKVARKNSIKPDNFRSPRVELLLGKDGWITCQENGIKYTYDVTKCMFSAGNITEKLRISEFDCSNETVIDMYAGIGYFTLPYLVHTNAAKVHACEWNPDAVEALRKNVLLNHVDERCVIHFGDNRKVCPVGIADRINLGLLPSSEPGYKTACLALRSTGGFLHIHSNVETKTARTKNLDSSFDLKFINENDNITNFSKGDKIKSKGTKLLQAEWKNWATKTAEKINTLLFQIYNKPWNVTILHVEHVKSYAPHIDHVVIDIECKPSE
ncbi:tRNA wybutosine-synthesizing protein 2 homolog [Centruroides vittatus]|uniref:tRNA wybutosine-synthesizing protein 2 homolog n=1 Tax=Centruroides vittatus TaxID=120091 RepID=UPI00350F04BE